jgi:predicted P-loop ATPase
LRAFRDNDRRNESPILIDAIRLDDPEFAAIVVERARQAAVWGDPAVYCPPVATFKTPRNAKADNLHEGVDLSTECDQNPREARLKLEGLLGPATIVVESGGEWTNPTTGEIEPKVHLHWRLKKPTSTKAEHDLLREARDLAAELVGGDGTNKSIVHPIRWAGSWHRKKTPRLAKTIASSDDNEIDLTEAVERLRDAAGAASFTGSGFKTTNGKLEACDHAAVASALSVIPNDDLEWDGWNRIGMATWAATGGSEAGRKAFVEWSGKSKKNDPIATEARWQHYKTSPVTKIGFGTLVWLARQHSPGWPCGKALSWRECRKNGSPVASLHNARLAIAAIGVVCSYDTFHDKMLFGYKDDTTRHVVEQFLGEVSDNGILSLRRLLSDRFGFDLTEKHVRDAVVSLALEHCFDPVADMLADAEANWDSVERLDRMAADYFSCEDTPLNAACVRKTMIAAVARVRQPGCKFDTIPVLESPEGKNKSTALRVLAGDENFSDEKIIGKDSREVQEQLAAVWIHENADLAGMRRAEVETVKAYASRQVDCARPAYGRFLKQQKRHSIEVGTTNGDEYLQSQTGNRRFWPMTVLKAIDIEKLRADRLQLWGEAAHYQSRGEALTIDEKMWSDAGEEQEKRRVKDPWETVLAGMPEMVEKKKWDQEAEEYAVTNIHWIIHNIGDQERVASEAILTHVLEVPIARQTTSDAMRLANAMKAQGWQRTSNGKVTINGKQVRGYFRWVVT